MDTTLAVTARSETRGKGGARRLRRAGQLPAVLYGPSDEARPVSLDPKALMDIFRQTQNTNTVLQVEVDGGKPVPCLVREVQRNPLSREVLHIDLLRVEKDREVQVMVPLKPVGRPKGLAMGGKLRMVRRELEVSCSYERIPKAIEVDVSHLDLGDNVRVEEVKAPEGVTLLFDSNFNVAAVHGRRVSGKKK